MAQYNVKPVNTQNTRKCVCVYIICNFCNVLWYMSIPYFTLLKQETFQFMFSFPKQQAQVCMPKICSLSDFGLAPACS